MPRQFHDQAQESKDLLYFADSATNLMSDFSGSVMSSDAMVTPVIIPHLMSLEPSIFTATVLVILYSVNHFLHLHSLNVSFSPS